MNFLSNLRLNFPHVHSYPRPSAPIRGSKIFPAPHGVSLRPAVHCVLCVLCGYLSLSVRPLRPFPALAAPFPRLCNSLKPRKSMVQIASNNVQNGPKTSGIPSQMVPERTPLSLPSLSFCPYIHQEDAITPICGVSPRVAS